MNEDGTPLSLVDLLDRLVEAPDPPPVSLVPQTEGWLVLGGLVLGLVAMLARRAIRRRRSNAYRRAALRELAAAGDDPTRIAEILRRAALAAYPRREVAGLSGEDWLGFLDRTIPGDGFRAGPGRVLAEAPYSGGPGDGALAGLARRWIRRHRREGAP